MCTAPHIINRKAGYSHRCDIVPCGKCHECVMQSQNEFAALAVLEAKRSKSMFMCALTYDNTSCPIMYTEKNELGEIVSQKFVDDPLERCNTCLPNMIRERFDRGRKVKYLVEYKPGDNTWYEPSLRREEVRLFLKKTRQAFFREYGYYPKFRYAAFGEYGDQFSRPHTHFLFFDFSDQEMGFFSEAWSKEFGFMDVKKIPILNHDGSPARVKVSKYVAKYLRKPKKDFQPLIENLCESPRLICSRGFGRGVLPDNLKSFYLCEDLNHLDFETRAKEILERKKSLIIDGSKFPLPKSISKDFFYDTTRSICPGFVPRVYSVGDGSLDRFVQEGKKRDLSDPRNGKRIYVRITPEKTAWLKTDTRQSALSVKVIRFARDRYFSNLVRKFGLDPEKLYDVSDHPRYESISEYEKSTMEDRVQRAKELYFKHLKSQKYG